MDTCLVLGAGPLLGRSLARRFGHGGHPVAVVARSGEALDELAAELRADGIDALALPADLGDPAALADAVTPAREQLGPIGVLIYNAAALGVRARPSELGLETLLSTLRVNLFGAVLAVQHAAPDMVRAGRGTVRPLGPRHHVLAPSENFAEIFDSVSRRVALFFRSRPWERSLSEQFG